ncbi:MAG: hypothetical protein GXY76_16850 [Chloroflexi bacterium]|nr:hypothetical protein [Chloroflexota bacterium]
MPIKNLTTNVRPQFPSLGTLRKGEARTEEDIKRNRPGADLPGTFRFTSDDPKIAEAFAAAYGTRPASLAVFLPNKRVADNWEAWQEEWVAGSLKHRCDGETCVLWQKPDGGYSTDPAPCPGKCKPVGRLQALIPELLQAGYVGYVTFVTTSKHDIRALQACLEDAEAKGNGHGLQGIEFRLYRVQQAISMWDDNLKKRVRRKKWLVKLTPSVRWVQAQIASAERQALGEPPEPPALPEPDAEEGIADGDDMEMEEYDEEEGRAEQTAEETTEAEAEVAAAAAETPADPAPSRADPYAHRELLREAAKDLARRYPTYKPSAAQQALVRLLIAKAAGTEGKEADEDRHAFLRFVWGKGSSAELDYGETKATINALIDRERSDAEAKVYDVNADAPDLVIAVLNECARLAARGEAAR